MTDEQVEKAARELCRIRGIDPESKVGHGYDAQPGDTFVPAVLLYSPAWTRAAIEIRSHDMLNRAIEFGISHAE